ncbi:MAG: hypothetical protein WA906_10045 [Pacificimonas sp.]
MFETVRAALAEIRPVQWIGGSLALAAVLMLGGLFVIENEYGYWKPEPEVVYFESWTGDRTAFEAESVQEEERRLRAETEALVEQLAAEALSDIDSNPEEAPPIAATSEASAAE